MKQHFQKFADFLSSKGLKNIEIFMILALLVWGYCTNLLSLEFHPDELYWIASSARFDKFLTQDFDDPIWSDGDLVNYEARPVPSYFAAIGQKIGGINTDRPPIYWDWEISTKENIARGVFPSNTLLWWSRLPMAIISVLSMAGVALLLAKAHMRLAAYIFVMVSLNGYFLAQLRRAWSESSLLLFTVLALYASYQLFIAVQGKSTNKVVLWSAAVGTFSGLASQSKLTGLACAGIAILGTMILMVDPTISADLARRRIPLIIAVVIFSTLLLTFIASYPFFYENTIDRILTTFDTRRQILQYQLSRYDNLTIPENARLAILFQRIFEYPIDLDPRGTRFAIFHWINLILASFGMYHGARQIKQRRKSREYFMVFLSGAVVCALPMLLTPLDWERYYLYPVFFSCIFFSLGMAELLYAGISYAQRQQNEEPPISEGIET